MPKVTQEEINLGHPISMNRIVSEINNSPQKQLPAQKTSKMSSATCSKEGETTRQHFCKVEKDGVLPQLTMISKIQGGQK